MVDDQAAWAAVPKGGWLQAYCQWAYTTTDAPMVYHLGAAYGVLSMAVDPSVALYLGGPMYGNLWCMLVGEAATSRKTSAGRKAVSVLTDAHPNVLGTMDHESVASFMEGLAERSQQFVYIGEYGDFLGSTARGSYKADLRDRLLRVWDGDRIEKRKMNQPAIVVESPRVSIVACVAPGLLEKHTTEHDWTDGGMSRWVLFYGRQTREEWSLPPDEEGRLALVETLKRRVDQPLGPCAGLEPDALARLVAWGQDLRARAASTRNRWTGPVYGRAGSVALKAALIASVDGGAAARSRGREWRLDDVSLQWGIRLAECHLASAAALLPDLSLSPYARKLRSVQDAVEGPGLRAYADVLRRVIPPQPKRDIDQCLELLVARGDVFKVNIPGQGEYLTVHKEAALATAVQTSREIGAGLGVGAPTPVQAAASVAVQADVEDGTSSLSYGGGYDA